MKYSVHNTALVQTKNIGEHSTIWAFTHILKGVKIGKNVNIGDHCYIEEGIQIGDNVTIKNGVSLWEGIVIEDNVFVGPHAVFTNDKFPRSKNRDYVKLSTLLKRGCSIGANATIIPGITIGEYAMIGAGSVVTRDVFSFELVYGNPAKRKGHVCVCGQMLQFNGSSAVCICRRTYQKKGDQIITNEYSIS